MRIRFLFRITYVLGDLKRIAIKEDVNDRHLGLKKSRLRREGRVNNLKNNFQEQLILIPLNKQLNKGNNLNTKFGIK